MNFKTEKAMIHENCVQPVSYYKALKFNDYCNAPKIFDRSVLANSADPVRSRQKWITVNKQIQFRQLLEEPSELDLQS